MQTVKEELLVRNPGLQDEHEPSVAEQAAQLGAGLAGLAGLAVVSGVEGGISTRGAGSVGESVPSITGETSSSGTFTGGASNATGAVISSSY